MIASNQAFCYFRAVFLSGVGASIVSISEWVLNGTIESVNITADGRVGLGVVAPVEALEVAGNMVVSGNMSAGNMGMFRNRIINGDMRIDQRNNGAASTTTGTYKLDRWTCLHGGGTVTGSVRRVNLTSADPPYNSGFINAIESTVSQTGGTWGVYFMFQRIEGNMIYDIINQPITVSFWAKGNSAFTLTVDVDRTVGGGGGDRVAKNVSITTSWTYYTLTWAIPSPAVTISSSTLTSDYLDLNFTCGINISNYILTCTGVQLEKGTRATPFEFRPSAIEMQLCQRYYWRMSSPVGSSPRYGTVVCRGGTTVHLTQPLPVMMRSQPSFVGGSGTFTMYPSGATTTGITGVPADCTIFTASWDIYVNVSLTAGFAQEIYGTVGSSYLDVSAEL
jgi:hypothetical protein